MGKLWLRINRPQGHWVVKPGFEPTSLWHSRLLGEPQRLADNQPSRSLKPHQELEQWKSWKGKQELYDHGRRRKERKAGRACTTGLGSWTVITQKWYGSSKLIHHDVKFTMWFKCNSAKLNIEACIILLLEIERGCNFKYCAIRLNHNVTVKKKRWSWSCPQKH